MEGLWIPKEILKLGGVTLTDRVILSVYYYYTVNGEKHCCTLTKEQIAEMLGVSCDTVERCRKKHKEYLSIKGNITKWFPAKVEDINNLLNADRVNDAVDMLCKCITAGLVEEDMRVKYFNKLEAYINDTYYGDKHIQTYKYFNDNYESAVRKLKKS